MKRIIALILALGLAFAPIAMAKDQNTDISSKGMTQGTLIRVIYNLVAAVNELTSSSAGVNKNANILNNWNVALLELVADHDADNDILNDYETLLEELAADHDTDVSVLGNYEALLEELAADHDSDVAVLGNYEALLEELAADHDSDVAVLGNYEALIEELAADHDADNNEFDLAVTELTELKADHDADNAVAGNVANSGIIQKHGALLGLAGLAEDTTDRTQVKTTNAITYTIDGTYYTKAGTGNFCNLSGLTAVQGTNSDYVSLGINSDGTCVITQGTASETPTWPSVPDNVIILGGLTITAVGGHNWASENVTDDSGTFVQPVTVTGALMGTFAPALTAANPTGFAADVTANATPASVAGVLSANTTPASVAGVLSANTTPASVAGVLSANTTPATVAADLSAAATVNVSSITISDATLGSGTKADPSVTL